MSRIKKIHDELLMAESDKAAAEKAIAALNAELKDILQEAIVESYHVKGDQFGTVRFVHDGFEFKVNTPKRVVYDQAILAAKWKEIADSGADPSEYIKAKYEIEEKKYAAWPSNIVAEFEAARTVKEGSMSIEFVNEGEK